MSYFFRVLSFQSIIISISYLSISFINYVDWFIINGTESDEFGTKGLDFSGSIYASIILSILGIFCCSITLKIWLLYQQKITNFTIGVMILFWTLAFLFFPFILFWENVLENIFIFLAIIPGFTSSSIIFLLILLKSFNYLDLWPKYN